MPKVDDDRYYSIQLVDLYTSNYGYLGSRSTGNDRRTFMVAGPCWEGETPLGVDRVFRCETDFSFVIFRTQLFGPGDLENVKKIQAGYGLETLSAFQKQSAPPSGPAIDWPKFDKKQAEADPFSYLSFLLQFCPTVGTAMVEKPLRKKFSSIGIGAGFGPANATGLGPWIRYVGTLADGTRLSAEDVVRHFVRPFEGAIAPPLNAEQWVAVVNARDNDSSLDPATAPARKDSKWEKYRNFKYSILGLFKTPEVRAGIPYDTPIDGGGDPTTQYFFLHLSRKFGSVYVMRGKMPTFPDSYGGGLAVMPDTQIQYWSLVSCEAAPSGHIIDGLCDMQVPLDAYRNYTIVLSRREDRPANATVKNGVAWLEWPPRGEGLDHPRNREDFTMLQIRIMGTNPNWKERPENVTCPGMEEEVMGPYFPRGEYTDKAGFEARGSSVAGG